MSVQRRSEDEGLDVQITLAPVAPIPFEYAEPDPARREAAWASFLAFARSTKAVRSGAIGTRDDWYDEMLDERSR